MSEKKNRKLRGLVARIFRRKSSAVTRKCEKCGQRSDICPKNYSFKSVNQDHFLCQGCRDNMKRMQGFVLRHFPRQSNRRSTHGALLGSNHPEALLTTPESRCTKIRAVESGYETVSSNFSSSSKDTSSSAEMHSVFSGSTSNKTFGLERLSLMGRTTKGLVLPTTSACAQLRNPIHRAATGPSLVSPVQKNSKEHGLNSGETHLCRHHSQEKQTEPNQLCELQNITTLCDRQGKRFPQMDQFETDKKAYDGYLVVLEDKNDLYQLKPPKDVRNAGANHRSTVPDKVCSKCRKRIRTGFRLPWQNAWLCEDCMDCMV